MRKVVRDIVDMANDNQVSDNHFRDAIRKLGEVRCEGGVMSVLARLHQEAIYETERDRYVH